MSNAETPHQPTHRLANDAPHALEMEVRQTLLNQSQLDFSNLSVHRVQGGVCLQGVVVVEPNAPDIAAIVASVQGVERVMNRLVTREATDEASGPTSCK